MKKPGMRKCNAEVMKRPSGNIEKDVKKKPAGKNIEKDVKKKPAGKNIEKDVKKKPAGKNDGGWKTTSPGKKGCPRCRYLSWGCIGCRKKLGIEVVGLGASRRWRPAK